MEQWSSGEAYRIYVERNIVAVGVELRKVNVTELPERIVGIAQHHGAELHLRRRRLHSADLWRKVLEHALTRVEGAEKHANPHAMRTDAPPSAAIRSCELHRGLGVLPTISARSDGDEPLTGTCSWPEMVVDSVGPLSSLSSSSESVSLVLELGGWHDIVATYWSFSCSHSRKTPALSVT